MSRPNKSPTKGAIKNNASYSIIDPRKRLLHTHRRELVRVVARAHALAEAPRHVLCAVTDTKEQHRAKRMAAYRRRGVLIADRVRALGL